MRPAFGVGVSAAILFPSSQLVTSKRPVFLAKPRRVARMPSEGGVDVACASPPARGQNAARAPRTVAAPAKSAASAARCASVGPRPAAAAASSCAADASDATAAGGVQGGEVKFESGETRTPGWRFLDVDRAELDLRFTLTSGQSFRWKATALEGEWRGVIRDQIVTLRHAERGIAYRTHAAEAASEADVEALLRAYFNLGHPLGDLYGQFAEADPRFRAVGPYLQGARVLRQDPVECLFSFICSSNNNISRITGMVGFLCRSLGRPLGEVEGEAYHAFPTLEALRGVPQETLRENGFGYRAPWIPTAARMVLDRGGEPWLQELRAAPRAAAQAALVELPGVGKKVAGCIALFALDKHDEIPVDTHVWQIAVRHYLPQLKNKTLTPAVYDSVGDFFRARFGAYAGWAHNVLFVSDLPQYQQYIGPGAGVKAEADSEEEAGAGGEEVPSSRLLLLLAALSPVQEGPAEGRATGKRRRGAGRAAGAKGGRRKAS